MKKLLLAVVLLGAGCRPVFDPRAEEGVVLCAPADFTSTETNNVSGSTYADLLRETARWWTAAGARVWFEGDAPTSARQLRFVWGGEAADYAGTYRWADGEVHMNPDLMPPRWRLTDTATTAALAHEVGHAFGLDHLPEGEAVMSPHPHSEEDAPGLLPPDVAEFRSRWF